MHETFGMLLWVPAALSVLAATPLGLMGSFLGASAALLVMSGFALCGLLWLTPAPSAQHVADAVRLGFHTTVAAAATACHGGGGFLAMAELPLAQAPWLVRATHAYVFWGYAWFCVMDGSFGLCGTSVPFRRMALQAAHHAATLFLLNQAVQYKVVLTGLLVVSVFSASSACLAARMLVRHTVPNARLKWFDCAVLLSWFALRIPCMVSWARALAACAPDAAVCERALPAFVLLTAFNGMWATVILYTALKPPSRGAWTPCSGQAKVSEAAA